MSGQGGGAEPGVSSIPEAARIGRCFRESVDLRFPVTASGRLRVERASAAVPRFYFGRSLATTLWRFAETLDSNAVKRLSRLAALEDAFPVSARFRGSAPAPPERLYAMARILEEDSREPRIHRALLFQLDSPLLSPRNVEAEITQSAALGGGPWEPGRSLWVARAGDAEVARVFAVRDFAGGAAELRVETLEAHRRQGLGSSLFARAAQTVLGRGQRVFASLPWPDRGARLFAERLGMQAIGEDCFVY